MATTIRDPLVDRVIDGTYRVLERLGIGAFGQVYRAEQLHLNREVAVKFLRRRWRLDPEIIERFEREARLCATIAHPNVVEIYDYGESEEGILYLAMELVIGVSLRRHLRECGPISPNVAVDVMSQLLDGLGCAHTAGVIHRDVKPSNVLLVPGADGRLIVKIIDFGTASPSDDPFVPDGRICGTPAYMAPELIRGPATVATDLYAAGVVLHELLFGRVPFSGDTPHEILRRHIEEPLPIPSEREVADPPRQRLWAVVQRAMAKDPADRFASAEHMRAALRGATTVSTRFRRQGKEQPGASRMRIDAATQPDACLPFDSVQAERLAAKIREVRRCIGAAIRRGAVDGLVSLYLREAELLSDIGDDDQAVCELEECVDIVTGGEGPCSQAGPPDTWRALARLAELEQRRGNVRRSRRLADAIVIRGLRTGDDTIAAIGRHLLARAQQLGERPAAVLTQAV